MSGEPNKIKVKLVLGGTKTINEKDLLDSRSENNVILRVWSRAYKRSKATASSTSGSGEVVPPPGALPVQADRLYTLLFGE